MSSTVTTQQRDDRLRSLAIACVVVAVICALTASALHFVALERAVRPGVGRVEWASLVIGTTWPLAGLVVLRDAPRNRCGWLLVATGLLGPYQLLGEYSIWNHFVSPLPFSWFTDWVSMFGFAIYLFVLPLVPMLFPDGRLPSPRWRPLAATIVVAASALTLARMFVPGPSDVNEQITNPIDVSWLSVLNYVTIVGAVVCNGIGVPAAIAALVVRTRRAVGIERAQLQWLILGGLTMLTGMVVSVLTRQGNSLVFDLGLLGPPLGIAIAVLRHRLVDVDLVLSRSLVFLAVLGVVGAGGAALLLRIDPDVTGTRAGVLLVAGLAVAIVALRAVLQHLIDRRWFPQRQGARQLGRRIAEAVSSSAEPREALRELIDAARSTLELRYLGFVGEMTVTSGARPVQVATLDAVAMGRRIGVLETSSRNEEGFAREERQVLEQVAAQAAMLAYSAGLVADVAQSRSSIVRAREEERRRLRNDLHDGVGPTLAGIALQADALARRVEGEEAREDARAIRDRLREAVAQVRAVSHGLRPPVLDQLGLSAALRQLVEGLTPIDAVAQVDELAGVPAAAEVAAYVVASEAVANAVKHSAASALRLEATSEDGHLAVSVLDNGRGMPARPSLGVGLTSMRQRAAEMGGRVEHRATPGGGTAVVLTLPLHGTPGERNS